MSELRALMVTPLSGPLARFGRATQAALELWAREAAELPQPWGSVQLLVEDAHPNPSLAMRRGLRGSPHLVFGPYGSGPSLKALAATRRVVWNHGGAVSALRWPAFSAVVNVLAPASTYFLGTLEAVRAAGPKPLPHVLILHGQTGFAIDVAAGAARSATRLGFPTTVIDFSMGHAEAMAQEAPEADILLLAGSFEDELAAGRVLLERRWRAAALVAAGVEEILAPLGALREGLLGPAQWVGSGASAVDEGPDTRWFSRRYRAATGSEPPYPAVQAFAAGVLAARCLRDAATPEDDALLVAAKHLECRTLYGEFRLDPISGLQVGHEVRTVQWQGGRRVVIWPRRLAEAPLIYPAGPRS